INPAKENELPISTLLGSFYSSIALVMSFLTGMTVVPNLLVEEKEKKTLRLLMVSPAGFADIITGKLLIALVYQLAMTAAVLLTMKSLSGNIPLLCLFTLCGACFTLALGLLAGCIFQTTTALGGFTGLMTMLFLFPAMFASDLIGTLLKGNPLEYVVRAIPTYYLADGFAKAIQNQGFNSTILLDLGVVAGCVAILIVASTVLLRRQASIAATI
ncbi:MAG: ABC transporter permease, partial [Ktedonobacteraceae bacterium]|nr:ABC transporter permease [Ktedonobacteraceae bacterium]